MAGCDTSFEAFEETDRAYSVFGILDASADTQFVRAEPVQDTALLGSGPVGGRVTSENLATGEEVVWRDSVFLVGLDEAPAYSFWTTTAIALQSTHRFTVERERDGAQSIAEVTVPATFSKPEVAGGVPSLPAPECNGSSAAPTTIRVEGVERLGAVRATYAYRICACQAPAPTCRSVETVAFPLAEAVRMGARAWRIPIFWSEHVIVPNGFKIDEMRLFRVTVASVSEDWPNLGASPPGDAALPLPPLGGPSNVEGGVGFLGGAVTRSVEAPVINAE